MIERGERNISLTNIVVFAKVFEISVSEILDFSIINPEVTNHEYETKSEEKFQENIRLFSHYLSMSAKKKG